MSGFWLRHLIYPLYEVSTGRRIMSKWRNLERTQWLSPPELHELQGQRLCALVQHAYDTVPYYRQIFGAAGIAPADIRQAADLCQLPLLTKEVIQTRREELISSALAPRERLSNQTGGSTGTPLHFYQDRRQRDWGSANKLRCNRWAGWDFGKRVLRLWGHPRDLDATRTAMGKLRNLALRERTLDAFRFTDQDLDDLISTIRRWQPQVIIAYASMLVHLIDHLEERQIHGLGPVESIISSADMLVPHQRARIENALGAPVFDRYGCREVDTIASECERHAGMHANIDRLVIELLDEKGYPVPSGQPGRVVITDLFNYAMPLIRYDIEDIATAHRGPSGQRAASASDAPLCECGRGLPLLGELIGRYADVLTAADGAYVSVSALSTILPQVPGLRDVQFVQIASDSLQVMVVRRSNYTQGCEAVFRQRLADILGSRMRVTFQYVDDIPKTPSGKARLSVSEIDPSSS
jgi:phenylacetate-CoA ligase